MTFCVFTALNKTTNSHHNFISEMEENFLINFKKK